MSPRTVRRLLHLSLAGLALFAGIFACASRPAEVIPELPASTPGFAAPPGVVVSRVTSEPSGPIPSSALPEGGGERGSLPPPFSASDPLDAAAITRTVQLYRASMRRDCWDSVIADAGSSAPTASLVADVTVELGRVTSVSVTGDSPSVGKCVQRHMKTWRFPGTGRFRIPFRFVAP